MNFSHQCPGYLILLLTLYATLSLAGSNEDSAVTETLQSHLRILTEIAKKQGYKALDYLDNRHRGKTIHDLLADCNEPGSTMLQWQPRATLRAKLPSSDSKLWKGIQQNYTLKEDTPLSFLMSLLQGHFLSPNTQIKKLGTALESLLYGAYEQLVKYPNGNKLYVAAMVLLTDPDIFESHLKIYQDDINHLINKSDSPQSCNCQTRNNGGISWHKRALIASPAIISCMISAVQSHSTVAPGNHTGNGNDTDLITSSARNYSTIAPGNHTDNGNGTNLIPIHFPGELNNEPWYTTSLFPFNVVYFGIGFLSGGALVGIPACLCCYKCKQANERRMTRNEGYQMMVERKAH